MKVYYNLADSGLFRFKTLIQGIGKDAQIEKLRDILTLTEN